MKKYILMTALIAGNWDGRLEAMQSSQEQYSKDFQIKKTILNSIIDGPLGKKLKLTFNFLQQEIENFNKKNKAIESIESIQYYYEDIKKDICSFITDVINRECLSQGDPFLISFISLIESLESVVSSTEYAENVKAFGKEADLCILQKFDEKINSLFDKKINSLFFSIIECEDRIKNACAYNNNILAIDHYKKEEKFKGNTVEQQNIGLQNQITNKKNNEISTWRKNIIDAIDDCISKDMQGDDLNQFIKIFANVIPVIEKGFVISVIDSSDQQLCNKSVEEEVKKYSDEWKLELTKDLNKTIEFKQSIYSLKGCHVSDYLTSLKQKIERIFESHGIQRQTPLQNVQGQVSEGPQGQGNSPLDKEVKDEEKQSNAPTESNVIIHGWRGHTYP